MPDIHPAPDQPTFEAIGELVALDIPYQINFTYDNNAYLIVSDEDYEKWKAAQPNSVAEPNAPAADDSGDTSAESTDDPPSEAAENEQPAKTAPKRR